MYIQSHKRCSVTKQDERFLKLKLNKKFIKVCTAWNYKLTITLCIFMCSIDAICMQCHNECICIYSLKVLQLSARVNHSSFLFVNWRSSFVIQNENFCQLMLISDGNLNRLWHTTGSHITSIDGNVKSKKKSSSPKYSDNQIHQNVGHV